MLLLTSDSMSRFCNRTSDEDGCDDVSKIINVHPNYLYSLAETETIKSGKRFLRRECNINFFFYYCCCTDLA